MREIKSIDVETNALKQVLNNFNYKGNIDSLISRRGLSSTNQNLIMKDNYRSEIKETNVLVIEHYKAFIEKLLENNLLNGSNTKNITNVVFIPKTNKELEKLIENMIFRQINIFYNSKEKTIHGGYLKKDNIDSFYMKDKIAIKLENNSLLFKHTNVEENSFYLDSVSKGNYKYLSTKIDVFTKEIIPNNTKGITISIYTSLNVKKNKDYFKEELNKITQ